MRKLPIGPLFIIIVIFLASHFANAQALPQKLPAKLPAKLPQKAATKKVAVRKAKKAAATTVASSSGSAMPKKLPAFKAKRVQINFEEIPSTPLDQSVVVMAPALNIPQDMNAIAASTLEELPQALPVKPPVVPAPPELAYVERPLIEVLPSEPTGELWQSDPNAVAAQPLTEAGVRLPQPSNEDVEKIETAIAAESVSGSTASITAALTESTSVATPVQTEVQTEAPADVNVAPVFQTPVFETPSASAPTEASVPTAASEPAVIESARLSNSPTEITTSQETRVSVNVESRRDEDYSQNKLFVRAGYLSAKYSDLASDLKDGASTLGFSYARSFSSWEAKASLDFAYGLDQEMSFRNTRMALVRGEALYLFRSFGFIRPLVGAGLGLANIDVTSYRQAASSDDLVLREHAQGTAFLISPQAGVRAAFSKSVFLDLTAQYLVLTGGENLSKLGGALVEASLGFGF